MSRSLDLGRFVDSPVNGSDLPVLIPLRHSTSADFVPTASNREEGEPISPKVFDERSDKKEFNETHGRLEETRDEPSKLKDKTSASHILGTIREKLFKKMILSGKKSVNFSNNETAQQNMINFQEPASLLGFSSPSLHSLASLTVNCYNGKKSAEVLRNGVPTDLCKLLLTPSNSEKIPIPPQDLSIPINGLLSPEFLSPGSDLAGLLEGTVNLNCSKCSFSGFSTEELDAHLQNVHTTFRCFICSFTTKSQSKLSRHLSEDHDRIDGFDFKKRKNLAAKRSKRLRKYSCKQCPFTTSVQEEIWTHTKVHVPASKLLTCPRCPFVCAFKHHMQYHLNNHFGYKPYKCDLCNYRCNNKSMLNSHLKSHSSEYPFKCSKCSYATKYRQALIIHATKANHAPDDLEKGDISASNSNKKISKCRRMSLHPGEEKNSRSKGKPAGRGEEEEEEEEEDLNFLGGSEEIEDVVDSREKISRSTNAIDASNANTRPPPPPPLLPTLSSLPPLSPLRNLSSLPFHPPPPPPPLPSTSIGSILMSCVSPYEKKFSLGEKPDHDNIGTNVDFLSNVGAIKTEPYYGDDDSSSSGSGGGGGGGSGIGYCGDGDSSRPLDLRVCKFDAVASKLDDAPKRCIHCDIIFQDSSLFWCHMACHNPLLPFKCNLCGQVTRNKVDFFVHLCEVGHHPQTVKECFPQ